VSPRPPVSPVPPVSSARVVVERAPLRVAEAGGRSQPPAAVGPQGERARADAGMGGVAPSLPVPRPPVAASPPAREFDSVEPGYSTAPSSTPAPVPPPGPRHHGEIGREVLRRPATQRPRSGWRWLVWVVTFGLWNLGESPADVRRRQLVARVNQTIRGDYKIAMLSLKGGVGKTTTTVGLGSTFASLRGDHVIAADANPDRGTLASRIPVQTTAWEPADRRAQRLRAAHDFPTEDRTTQDSTTQDSTADEDGGGVLVAKTAPPGRNPLLPPVA